MAWILWRGRWATLCWTDPATGEKSRRALRTDAPDVAEAERRRCEREVERRPDRAAGDAAAARADWLADLRARGLRPDTIRFYSNRTGPVVEALAGRPLSTWSARDVDRAILDGKGRAAPTQRSFYVAATQFLRWCAADGRGVTEATLADWARIKRPRGRSPEKVPLSPAQMASLLRAARGTEMEPAVALAGYVGLSRGDIKAIRWDEVDFAARSILRRRGRQKTGERLWVPMPAELVAVLERHRHAGPLVCRLPGYGRMRVRLVRLFDSAAIPREKWDGWHRLRHTAATRLAQTGADVATIGAALGHAPGSPVTLKYLHPEADRLRAAVDAAAAAVTRAGEARRGGSATG